MTTFPRTRKPLIATRILTVVHHSKNKTAHKLGTEITFRHLPSTSTQAQSVLELHWTCVMCQPLLNLMLTNFQLTLFTDQTLSFQTVLSPFLIVTNKKHTTQTFDQYKTDSDSTLSLCVCSSGPDFYNFIKLHFSHVATFVHSTNENLPFFQRPKQIDLLILAPIYRKITFSAVCLLGDDSTCFWCHFSLGHCPISMQSWRRKYHPLSFSQSMHRHLQSK